MTKPELAPLTDEIRDLYRNSAERFRQHMADSLWRCNAAELDTFDIIFIMCHAPLKQIIQLMISADFKKETFLGMVSTTWDKEKIKMGNSDDLC